MIVGAPRSGTNWLGKIFDSHPAVIYRREPSGSAAPSDFPANCAAEDIPLYTDAVRRHVARLMAMRAAESSATRPIFAKSFQPLPAAFIRRTLALAIRAGEGVPFAAAFFRRIPIADFISGDAGSVTYVVESVSLIGAVALLAKALPQSRVVLVFRHPCGQIASIKRAVAAGRTLGGLFGPRTLTTANAHTLGMKEHYEAMPMLDRWAWAWALMHAKLFEGVRDLPNVRVLCYESFCEAPIAQARELIRFARLSWADETQRFVEETSGVNRRRRSLGRFGNPTEMATKWKRELTGEEIARVADIVEHVLPTFPLDIRESAQAL